jgi:hypothetical protein
VFDKFRWQCGFITLFNCRLPFRGFFAFLVCSRGDENLREDPKGKEEKI